MTDADYFSTHVRRSPVSVSQAIAAQSEGIYWEHHAMTPVLHVVGYRPLFPELYEEK